MANIHILPASLADAGTISGGAWETGLPLTHLQNPQPKKVARSVDLNPASTRFVVDMAHPRVLSMVALIATNLSNSASWRIRVSASSDGSSPTLDVTRSALEPNVVWGSLPWGAFPWEGFSEDIQADRPVPFYKHPTAVIGRYLLIDIADPTNPAGYIDIGRLHAGEAFVPGYNMVHGVEVGFVDETKQSRSVGGQVYSDRKPLRRRLSCSFDALTEGEAYGAAFDMLRDLGLSGNLLVVYDPDDAAAVRARRTIYGRLTELAPIVTANSSTNPYNWRLALEELI